MSSSIRIGWHDQRQYLPGAGFRMVAAGVFDLFPHTAHVESLAVFDRQERAR